MYILGIDTSSTQTGVALLKDGALLGSINKTRLATQSSGLLPMIDQLLNSFNILLQQSDLICVTSGPGSFTGIRVGLGSAYGLAESLGAKIVAVGSLDAIARANSGWKSKYFCSVSRSRLGFLYAALYTEDSSRIKKLAGDVEVSPDILAGMIVGSVTFAGEGFILYEKTLCGGIKHRIGFMEENQYSAAVGAAMLAHENSEFIQKTPEPKYISRSQAEINQNNSKIS